MKLQMAQQMTQTHAEIHNLAKDLLNMSETDPEGAVDKFFEEVDPETDQVINGLYNIDNVYATEIAKITKNFETLMMVIIVVIIVAVIAIGIFSFFYGRRLALQIAAPVMMVADWAKNLSLGAVDLSVAGDELSKMEKENADNEVGLMITAFHTMAENIRENVAVVQRIADGDMTAFVKIRSRRDSLGKSLYRLVQSNDIIFNEIVESAH